MTAEQSREGRSSTAAHTPGPWQVHDLTDGDTDSSFRHSHAFIYSFEQEFVANVPTESAAQQANARMIAAAPDMLAALQDWLWYAEGALHEFDLEDCEQEELCPRCREVGCINMKIKLLRSAITAAVGDRPAAAQPQIQREGETQ